MENKEINELVEKLDEALSEHGLNFDEYLLYRAIHTYENNHPEIIQSLENKGLIKDGKIVDCNKIDGINETLSEFYDQDNKESELDRKNFLFMLAFFKPKINI